MANDFQTQEVTYSDGSTSTLTFSWSVTGLKTKNESGNSAAVVQTYWKLEAEDSDGHKGEFTGATPFTSVGMTGDFVDFSELTEEMVVGWIKSEVAKSTSYQDHIFDVIFKKIDHVKSEFVDATMPWAPPVEAAPGTGLPTPPAPI